MCGKNNFILVIDYILKLSLHNVFINCHIMYLSSSFHYKVVDSSDVVVQVLDVKHTQGTSCHHLEKRLKENCKHKHVILLLNKCDLILAWATKGWLHVLSRYFPIISFHVSIKNSFRKGSLLQKFTLVNNDKQTISVGL